MSNALAGLFNWVRGERVVVVEYSGIIMGGSRTTRYVRFLQALRDDPVVKAVVLDLDSPGGTASAARYLYGEAARLAQRKPLVVFVRGVAASGGYMLSCAATRVVAYQASVIGSIGVISSHPILQDLLEKVGVKFSVTKSGRLKDMGAFYREPTEEEVQRGQALVNEFFADFVSLVARSRRLTEEKVREYATGEIFTAPKALEMGLVDEVGDLERAIDLASELGKVRRRVVWSRPRRSRWARVLSGIGSEMSESIVAGIEDRLSRRIWYV